MFRRLRKSISEDPAAFDLRWPNLYLYVNNSPTGLVDPSGLSPQVIGPFICTWSIREKALSTNTSPWQCRFNVVPAHSPS